MGYLTYGTDAADMLFHVVNAGHLEQRSMIFTTNKSLSAWLMPPLRPIARSSEHCNTGLSEAFLGQRACRDVSSRLLKNGS